MRQQYRPEFVIRRTWHHSLVSLGVWRRNREAARAFRDPLIDGHGLLRGLTRNPKATSMRKVTVTIGAAALIAAGYFIYPSQRAAQPELLAGVPSADEPLSVATAGPQKAAVPNFQPGEPAKAASMFPPPPAPSQAASADPAHASDPSGASSPSSAATPSSNPSSESGADGKAAVASKLPSNPEPQVYHFPEKGYGLVACKRDRTLYVYKHEGKKWEKAAAFPMAFGRKGGDKSDEGDRRTPEGGYWVTAMFPGPVKGPLYGSLVFTLNYPKPGDLAEGKTGQGIWIHGVERGKRPTYTHGCISLANDDMVGLAAFVDVGTPILILPDSLIADPVKQMDLAGMEREYPAIMAAYARKTHQDTLAREQALNQARAFVAKEVKDFPNLSMESVSEADKQAILERLSKWKQDWCSRNIDAYAQNYASNFKDNQGRDMAAFLDRKKKIFASKNLIEMEMGKPEIEAEGYDRAKVTFRQDYSAQGPGGVQRSSSNKSLHLESSPAGWLIVNE